MLTYEIYHTASKLNIYKRNKYSTVTVLAVPIHFLELMHETFHEKNLSLFTQCNKKYYLKSYSYSIQDVPDFAVNAV